MHEEIERFTREPILIKDDKDFIRLKNELIRDLEDEMYESGYMRVIDLEAHWSSEYNFEKQWYECRLSLYGVYVGESDCPTDQGISNGRKIKIR